jgi:hypothetical protein
VSSQSTTLDLTVVCDETDSEITLTLASSDTSWVHDIDTEGSFIFDYSHYYCGEPTVDFSAVDDNGVVSADFDHSDYALEADTQ